MSHEHPDAGGASDYFNTRKVFAVGIVAVSIFVGSVIVASLWQSKVEGSLENERGIAPPGAKIGAMEVGIVNQELFPIDTRFQQKKHDKLARLGSYGWIDKERGLVHIPVDKAMDMVVEQVAAAQAAAKAAAPTPPAPLPVAPSPAAPAPVGHPPAKATPAAPPGGHMAPVQAPPVAPAAAGPKGAPAAPVHAAPAGGHP